MPRDIFTVVSVTWRDERPVGQTEYRGIGKGAKPSCPGAWGRPPEAIAGGWDQIVSFTRSDTWQRALDLLGVFPQPPQTSGGDDFAGCADVEHVKAPGLFERGSQQKQSVALARVLF